MLKGLIRNNLANLITLGRIPFCFTAFTFAIIVIRDDNAPAIYGFLGVIFLIITALTDYWDGLVARKMNIVTKIGPLADQMMDKMVYCIIFPAISVGIMKVDGEKNIDHVILALILCVTMLVRDHYVSFLRSIATRHNVDSGVKEIGKIRTFLALPTSCVMFGYCFCRGQPEDIFYFNSIFIWIQHIEVRMVMIVEIALLIINVVSAISYTRLYGAVLLTEICGDDEIARKKVLSIFPNMLTLMNAIMGISAAMLSFRGKYHIGFILLISAAIFDKLDGAAARKLGLTEDPLPGEKNITPGMILDDIADFISFCVAPAAITYAYLRGHSYAPLLLFYVGLGFCRLIYFTIDKRPIVGFFKGLPSPAGALLVGGIVHAANTLNPDSTILHTPVLIAVVATGVMMNAYFIRYIHFGRLMSKSKNLTRVTFFIFIVGIFWVKGLGFIALTIMGFYLCSPFFVKPPLPHESGTA